MDRPLVSVVAMAALALALGIAPSLTAQEAADTVAPEPAATGEATWPARLAPALAAKAAGEPVTASRWMIAAANPLAVDAGAAVLAQGGSAADAMVATQAVLGLVEPQSSGLGGGAFLVWYDAASGAVTTLDGRETAPMAATPQLFQDATGEPLGFFDAVVGGRSVGTPGTPALMQAAHDRWGTLEWPGLFDRAIDLAEGGFAVSPRLAGLVAADAERLSRFPATRAYFLPGGVPLAEGARLQNPAYAASLRAIAAGGAAAFYSGPIAESVVAAVQGAPGNPGLLTLDDMASYRVKERPAVCAPYRGHEVCGMGPPSSGGLTVGQILMLLAPHDIAALGPDSPAAWRLIGDASRLAFADRGRYMADSDFEPVPVKGLLDPGYMAARSGLLAGDDALPEVAPGMPPFDFTLNWADGAALELPSTSHIVIVDAAGNVVSMTTTIENGFGSRLMAASGFLLNNELTDFSFRAHRRRGGDRECRVAPGKRPRSSMSADHRACKRRRAGDGHGLARGLAGSSAMWPRRSSIAMMDWGMDVQQALDAAACRSIASVPSIWRLGRRWPRRWQAALAALGYEVTVRGT
jgi:gamma-glutamyltranspeptidase/glutathione hydrolase